ncbi:MAG: type II toxin-antitoxin system VapC family toxin [Deltaproteobacteria bacterium]|nr:type II toxin-antitoxin system VapC family toxin [Deltaproteobacteria bacterium]
MMVLDTHALLWWALDPDKLSRKAKTALTRMEDERGWVSSISFWELAIKVERGQLELGVSVDELARRVARSKAVEIVPVDTDLWLASVALEWEHRDPADRVIAATALQRNVPLLTKDQILHDWGGVRCVW